MHIGLAVRCYEISKRVGDVSRISFVKKFP